MGTRRAAWPPAYTGAGASGREIACARPLQTADFLSIEDLNISITVISGHGDTGKPEGLSHFGGCIWTSERRDDVSKNSITRGRRWTARLFLPCCLQARRKKISPNR